MGMPYVVLPPAGGDPSGEWLRLGYTCQMEAGGRVDKLAEAERNYNQALRLNPADAVSTHNLAILYVQLGNINEALLTIERACLIDQDKSAVMFVNRAYMALEAGRVDDALRCARKAKEIAPDDTSSKLAVALIVASAGLPGEAVPIYNEILDKEPAHPLAAPNACFAQTLTPATPAELLKQRTRWWEANRFKGTVAPHHRPDPSKPLRIGYVGGDFKQHSASMIFGNVLLNHTSAVDAYYYSNLPVDPKSDGLSAKFVAKAGPNWRDISGIPDDAVVDKMIRDDKIDILVDLAGHTGGNRLTLFTRKPAPIQVTAWGFAHGTGCPEVDYFFADPVAVPQEERKDFAEKIWDLPCVVTYLEPEAYKLKVGSPLPYHHNEYITFGAFARYEKMTDACLKMYADLLDAVPDAKMIFKDAAYRRPYSIRRVISAMKGIDRSRLLFSINTNHPEHMQSYQQADIIVDPYPHSGGVVCMEQIYMGMPIVTLYGTQPSGRTTSAVLTAMGRTEWIAKTPEEYVKIAVRLTKDIPALGKLRKTLRGELLASNVIVGYAEAVEKAYHEMAGRYVAGLPAA